MSFRRDAVVETNHPQHRRCRAQAMKTAVVVNFTKPRQSCISNFDSLTTPSWQCFLNWILTEKQFYSACECSTHCIGLVMCMYYFCIVYLEQKHVSIPGNKESFIKHSSMSHSGFLWLDAVCISKLQQAAVLLLDLHKYKRA